MDLPRSGGRANELEAGHLGSVGGSHTLHRHLSGTSHFQVITEEGLGLDASQAAV